MFIRRFSNLSNLTAPNNLALYNLLKKDVQAGVVFPAIRNNSIDFYYKGGKLFEFKGGTFKTHIKYAAVLRSNKKQDYLSPSDFSEITYVQDFASGYERIKENCSLYAGIESDGVSRLYSRYSYARNIKLPKVMVLDIEIAFEKGVDRIDFLLYNTTTQTLRFYEAKHYSNKELWSQKGTEPRVIQQLKRYDRQIRSKNNKQNKEIIDAYANYVACVNQLFGLGISNPQKVEDDTALIIFGFDQDQLKGRLTNLLIKDLSLKGRFYYTVGDIGSARIENIWNNTKLG